MRWAELNLPQLASVSKETICVLPIGAIEQHGPHLPVATDLLIAEGFAKRLDTAFDEQLLIMPSVSVTCSAHHMAFAGTLSIEPEVFLSVVGQTIQCAARHGLRRFFLLNAHGGNMAVGGVVAEQLAAQLPNCDIVFVTWFRTATEELRQLVEGAYPAVGHACEFETSLIMAMHPELVDTAAIADDGVPPASPLPQTDLLRGGPSTRSIPFDRITKNGVWGKPSLASARKGHAILEIVIPALRDLLIAHWPSAANINNRPHDGHVGNNMDISVSTKSVGQRSK
jgi:creatinine amidohydrolase